MKRFLNYQWIKDNLTLILLIPTLLGGFWQVTELAYVGTPYIRFFSVSQLISDGIMILFVLVIVYLMFRFLWWTVIDKAEAADGIDDKKEPIKIQTYQPLLNRKDKYKIIGSIFIYLLLTSAFFYFYWGSLWWVVYYADRFYTFEIPFILFGIFIPVVFAWIIIKKIFTLVDVRKVLDSKAFLPFFGIILIVLCFTLLYSLTKFIPWIHRSYLLPNDLKNIEYLDCKINKSNVSLKSYNIQYFNDKYIFVELHYGKMKSKIEVVKFDDFFFDTACNIK